MKYSSSRVSRYFSRNKKKNILDKWYTDLKKQNNLTLLHLTNKEKLLEICGFNCSSKLISRY